MRCKQLTQLRCDRFSRSSSVLDPTSRFLSVPGPPIGDIYARELVILRVEARASIAPFCHRCGLGGQPIRVTDMKTSPSWRWWRDSRVVASCLGSPGAARALRCHRRQRPVSTAGRKARVHVHRDTWEWWHRAHRSCCCCCCSWSTRGRRQGADAQRQIDCGILPAPGDPCVSELASIWRIGQPDSCRQPDAPFGLTSSSSIGGAWSRSVPAFALGGPGPRSACSWLQLSLRPHGHDSSRP